MTGQRKAPGMAHRIRSTTKSWGVPLKELEKLQKLISDGLSTRQWVKQDPCDTRLSTRFSRRSTCRRRRSRRASPTEAGLTILARTVEARKKGINERQKEIFNNLARYGKALDKVRFVGLTLWGRADWLVRIEIHEAIS